MPGSCQQGDTQTFSYLYSNGFIRVCQEGGTEISQGVGFSEEGYRVRRDGARLGELAGGEIKGGYLSPRQGALVERLLSPMSPMSPLSPLSPLSPCSKKPTRVKVLKSAHNSGVQGTKSLAGARGALAFPFPPPA